jgi:hypothetical protein
MNTKANKKLKTINDEPTSFIEAKEEISKLRQKLYKCLKEKKKIEDERNLFYQAINNKCIFYYGIYEFLRNEFINKSKKKDYQEFYKKEITQFFELGYTKYTRKTFPFFLLVYKFKEDIRFIKSFGYFFKESNVKEEQYVSYEYLIDIENPESFEYFLQKFYNAFDKYNK